MQASGAAIVASGIKDWASGGTTESGSVTAGNDILISGLAIQVGTFGVFIALALKFHARAAGLGRVRWAEQWMKILVAIYISSGFILVSVAIKKGLGLVS